MPNDTTEWKSLVLFSGIKRPGFDICHSQPSRAECRHAQSYASNPSLVWWRVLNLTKKNYILVHQHMNLVNHEIQKIEGLTSESAVYQNRNLPLFWVNFKWDLFTEKKNNWQWPVRMWLFGVFIAHPSWHNISLNYSKTCTSLAFQIHTYPHPTLGGKKTQNCYSH